MTAVMLNLQETVFSALKENDALVSGFGGAKFHDLTPAGLPFPYLTFGRATTYDWSTSTEDGSEHFFALHVWSKCKGRREALALMELVRAALHHRHLEPDGLFLVNLRLESTQIRFDEDLNAYQGTLNFRAVVERPSSS